MTPAPFGGGDQSTRSGGPGKTAALGPERHSPEGGIGSYCASQRNETQNLIVVILNIFLNY